MASALPPLLKWPGGKAAELPRILPLVPPDVDRYLEPFVGGGAVWLAIPPEVPAHVNDVSGDLVRFYRHVQHQDERLLTGLDGVARWWQRLADLADGPARALVRAFRGGADDVPEAVAERGAVALRPLLARVRDAVPPPWTDLQDRVVAETERSVPAKLARMRRGELRRGRRLAEDDVRRNVEGALKAATYTTLRGAYNRSRSSGDRSPRRSALFFFLREYAYAAMFRFNGRGEFNVPYGGITYNRKDLEAKVAHLRSRRVAARLGSTTFDAHDFAAFLERRAPGPADFLFVDPPYDSDFSSYDGNGFGPHDHDRLAAALRATRARFLLVIKDTPAVRARYTDDGWWTTAFAKTYPWTIKERNDRAATHLVVTNYRPTDAPCGP